MIMRALKNTVAIDSLFTLMGPIKTDLKREECE
jgi:hypothetical protein